MVSQMSVGDEILMVVPSSLAFGDRGNEQFNILPYTPVVFDVELLNILPPKQ
jgi:FKBP-type peptidyl-prolyl cis-trans isomerase